MSSTDEAINESEIEKMRKFAAFRKVATGILRKWSVVLIGFLLLLSGVFATYLVWHFAHSYHRFDARTRLLYNPRKAAKIENIGDKQLLSILERPSLKKRVGQAIELVGEEKSFLTFDLTIVQERRPSNLFTLTAHSRRWVDAVRKVNAYAQILIDEYIAYRERELENLLESLTERKATLQKRIAEIESEETIAKGKTGVASPVETLTTINALLSDQRRNLSMLSVEIANEEVKRNKLEADVGPIGPTVIANASAIRKKSDALETIDKEIAELRETYTDINPKVKGKIDDRTALLQEYLTFLQEKGMEGIAIEDLIRIEKATADLAEVATKMDVLNESRRSLEQEIADNEKKSADLIQLIPSIERLRVKREDLGKTMLDIDDQIDNIAYLQMSISSDLQQIERAGGAGDKNPLSPKNFLIAFVCALVATAGLGVWILFFELFFGNVLDGRELGASGDIDVIGSLPKPDVLPEEEEKDVLGVVALNLLNADRPNGSLLFCRLPGAPEQPKFMSALDWALSMSGSRNFTLNIVMEKEFKAPEDAETMISTIRKGSTGWFPVSNRFSLAPTELQILQADIAALREDFDDIFIFMPDGMRRGGSFFNQLLSVCDSTILLVGASTTPRSELEYARRHVKASGKPTLGLIVSASAKIVRREMEAKR